MAKNDSLEMAYDAGRAMILSEPPERRSAAGCPFSAIDHPEQREAWLDGFESALDEQENHRDALKEARDA